MLTNDELDKKILRFEQSEEKRIKKEAKKKEEATKKREEEVKKKTKEILKKKEEKVIKSKNPEAIYEFAKNVKEANIDKLEDVIIAIGKDSIKDSNFDEEDAKKAYQAAEYMYNFAENIEGAHIDKLEDAIIAICVSKIAMGVNEYVYKFARNIKEGKNIDKLEDAIIATGDAEYIYYFARDVKDANIKKLEDAIMETKNAKYICCFIQVMYGSSIIIDRDVRSIGTVEDTSEIDKLENMNIDQIEFDMILKKYDLKVIGEKLKNSFLNKLYFERKNYTLKYLIKNKELDINEIRLRIYFDYLNNPNSTEEDLEKCNEEYIRYISMFYDEKNKDEEDKNNVKVKKIQK